MHRLFTYLLVAAAGALFACSGSETTNAAAETTAAATPDPDSLRQAFEDLMAQREDPMPVESIREAGKLYPVDEAPLDTAFFVFRENLRRAVAERNILGVMEAVDENIKASFGSENGLADFVRLWGLESEEKTQQSELWAVLGKVLEGGGAFQQGRRQFTAPYVSSTWPEQYDTFTHAAITGAGVRLRSAPSLNSRTLTQVSHDIVELLGKTAETETVNGLTAPWAQVRTLDGTEGYVWSGFVASPIDFRAIFREEDGRWKMSVLVAGD